MVLISFFFSLQASYRFLILTCYFNHLDGLKADNIIPDLLSSAISIYKVSFRSVITVHNRESCFRHSNNRDERNNMLK